MLTAQIAGGFRGLRFVPMLEAAFRARFDALNRVRTRVSLVAGALLIVLFGIFRHPTMPDASRIMMIAMDFGIVAPYALLVVALSGTRVVAQRLELFAAGGVLAFGLGRVALYALAWQAGELVPYEGLLLIMTMGFLTMGLTFRHALACCGIVWLAFVAFVFVAGLPHAVAVQHAFFATAFFVATASAAYLVEHALRRSYLHERLATLLADTDDITNLPNRRRFHDAIAPIWRHAQRSSQQVALTVVDIDEFKAFNDAYGRKTGDDALARFAPIIAESCRRPFDVCARLSGNQFVMLWPDTSPREAMQLAQTIAVSTRALAIPHRAGARGVLTTSVGVVVTVPGDDDVDLLLSRADAAVQRAKAGGRSRVVFAE